jgi:MerR, DNA binding
LARRARCRASVVVAPVALQPSQGLDGEDCQRQQQVRALLRLSDDREQSCAEVDRLAGAQLAEVDRRIADLKVLRRELSDLIGQCRHGTIADCRIIEVLGSAFRPQPGA